MRLAGALVWHWRRGYPYEGRRWLQKAASVSEPGTADPELLELLGWCQAGAALLAWLNFEREAARAELKEAIDLLRRAPNRLKLAHALGWLGMVESDLDC